MNQEQALLASQELNEFRQQTAYLATDINSIKKAFNGLLKQMGIVYALGLVDNFLHILQVSLYCIAGNIGDL